MERNALSVKLSSLLEELAAVEHERWSHWQKYMHSKGTRQADGSLVIPADLVAQWDSQISRPYTELTNEEKESDREQVRKYLPVIVKGLAAEE